MMPSTHSLVHVCLDSVGGAVSRTLTSVKVTPVKTEPTVPTVSTATPAPAHLASAESTVRSTLTTAPTALALMEEHAWMASMPSPAYVYLDLLEATANMT